MRDYSVFVCRDASDTENLSHKQLEAGGISKKYHPLAQSFIKPAFLPRPSPNPEPSSTCELGAEEKGADLC